MAKVRKTPWRAYATTTLKRMKADVEKELAAEEDEMRSESKEATTPYPTNGKSLYKLDLLIYAGVQVALLVLASVAVYFSVKISLGIPINVGVLVILLQTMHLAKSFETVGIEDLPGISRFRQPLYEPSPGLHIIIYGVHTLMSANRNYLDKRFPGPADDIFRISAKLQENREEGDMPPEGKVRPVIVMTGEPKYGEGESAKKDNPLDRQLNVEISWFLRYRPSQENGGIFRIVKNLASKKGKLDEQIEDLMREQTERDIKAIFTTQTPATIVENWQLVNEIFILKCRLVGLRLGIDVDMNGAGLVDQNFGHNTNEAQANVTRAEFDAQTAVIAATAEKQTLTLTGEGRGAANKAETKGTLEGKAEGYEALKKATGVDGDSVLAAETASDATKHADTIIVGAGGITDLLGLVKAGQGIIKKSGPKEEAVTDE